MQTRPIHGRLLGLAAAGLAVLSGCGAAATLSPAGSGAPHAAAIEVRLSAMMAPRSVSKARTPQVPFAPGLTTAQVAAREGFRGADLDSMMVVVNGVQTDWSAALAPGDRVELLTGMAGG